MSNTVDAGMLHRTDEIDILKTKNRTVKNSLN